MAWITEIIVVGTPFMIAGGKRLGRRCRTFRTHPTTVTAWCHSVEVRFRPAYLAGPEFRPFVIFRRERPRAGIRTGGIIAHSVVGWQT